MTQSPHERAIEAWFAGDCLRAETTLLALAHAGDGHAAHNLATLYGTGGEGLAIDREKSRFWHERALRSGFEATVASDPTWFRRVERADSEPAEGDS